MTLWKNRWTCQRVKNTESNEVVTARRDDGRASSCVMTAPGLGSLIVTIATGTPHALLCILSTKTVRVLLLS